MNRLKVFVFLLMLSASLAGCYTQFTAADADGGRPESFQYSESYDDYAPSDSSYYSGQTTIINNYYGPYSRFFTPSGYWTGHDPFWYDPFWYDPFWRPSAFFWGFGFYYDGYPYHHHYPRYNHYYTGGGGSSGNQMPRTSGRLRSSYRSSKSPITMPDIRPATLPRNISTRPVQVQTAPQTTGGGASQGSGNKNGSSERQVKPEARPSVRTRLIQKPATRQTDSGSDSRESQRTNNPGGTSNDKPASRQEPRSSSPPPAQNSETRGGGNGGSGNTSTRQR
ncbi:MAG: hypothetical protein HGB19_06345 [Chlorobiales bacterium]|jgi:hypothetical protein|nr:hypothetical protein [Chlorobiales bacterium]